MATFNFETITFAQANEAIMAVKSKLDTLKANRNYIDGDDWQNGDGWVGPQFNGTGKINRELKNAIEREFTPKGAISGVVRRHRRGVIGRVPGWNISSRKAPAATPAEGETDPLEPLIAEAQQILNEFWKVSRVHKELKNAVDYLLSMQSAPLRLFFVQNGSAETNEIQPPETINEAVRRIRLFAEQPGTACVITDRETLKSASFYRYEKDGVVYIEMCYINDDGITIFKELSQNDSTAKSFARQNLPTIAGYIPENQPDDESQGLELPLSGKLLVFEMQGRAFVTPAMRAQQKLVNKAYTMMSHNLDVSGFRERVYLNAMPPGAVEVQDGKSVFVPDENAVEVGAGRVSYTQGLRITERDPESGKVKATYTSPQIFESDPVPIKTFIDTAFAATEAILEEADQKHIAISGDATASGESRIQARDDYRQSLEDTKSELDDVMSDCSEAVLAVVAYLMGKPSRYDELQVSFNAIINAGPVSSDERRIAIEEGDKLYRSRESVMEQLGINDPDAMKLKIKLEGEGERRLNSKI